MTNTNTTPMPPVPADLGRIELTFGQREAIIAEALSLGLDLRGESAEQIQAMIERAGHGITAETQAIDIDAIIKDVGSSVYTNDQWVDLGLACLDQAGVSLRDQDRIMAILQGAGQ